MEKGFLRIRFINWRLFWRASVMVLFVSLVLPSLPHADTKRALERSGKDERRVALVIGNAAYDNQPLRNPVNDARAMSKTLTNLGFEVLSVENANRRDMQRAILEFSERLKDGGVGLFYYAGHGIEVRGRNYLVPTDENITSEASVRFEAVGLDAVLEQMGQPRPNRMNIVILDACRNNPYASRYGGSGSGLALVDAPVDFLLAYATAPGRIAVDGEGENGLYTQEILKAIQTPNQQIEDVFKRVRSAVSRATRHAQTPWEASSLTRDFTFVQEEPPKRPQVAEVMKNEPASEENSARRSVGNNNNNAALELAFWDSIKGSDTADDYKAYLETFPTGTFSPLARLRIRQLETEAKIAKENLNSASPKQAPAKPELSVSPKVTQKPTPTLAPAPAPAPAPTPKIAVEQPKSVPPLKTARIQSTPAPKTAETTNIKPASLPPSISTGSASGKEFTNCSDCPVMVPLSRGEFLMGGRELSDAKPVRVGRSFAIGKYPVTYGNWKACVADGGCKYNPTLKNSSDNSPMRNVSWVDADNYIKWLRQKTGKSYRLPTEAEWEYAARGGASSRYIWGDKFVQANTDCVDCGGPYDRKKPADVGSFNANKFGLHDMLGGVWEWVQDCWDTSLKATPADGSARSENNCLRRTLRGGSWKSKAADITLASRFHYDYAVRYYTNGFRVALTLN